MKTLLALDAKLLGWAEWVVKKWNWWTGKDQFCLARIEVALGSFLFVLLYLILPIKDNRKDFPFTVLITIGLLVFMNFMTRSIALKGISDSLRGTKSGDPFWEVIIRLCFLILAILMFFSGLAPGRAEGFCLAEMYVFVTAWLYLLEVPNPPFKRSQAIEALERLFAKPVPVPVSSN